MEEWADVVRMSGYDNFTKCMSILLDNTLSELVLCGFAMC